MSVRSVLSKSFAYLVIVVIFISLFLAFVTVPFHGPDSEPDRTSIELEEVRYPAEYGFGFERVEIANQNSIIEPEILMDEHVSELSLSSNRMVNYTYNSTDYVIHWSDESVILEQPDNQYFITQGKDIQMQEKGNVSNKAEVLQERYVESDYGRFNSNTFTNVEKSMINVMNRYNYTAVEAWESEERTYIKYEATKESVNSSFIITESGLIHRFNHEEDIEIEYKVLLDDSSPPFFKPPWTFEES